MPGFTLTPLRISWPAFLGNRFGRQFTLLPKEFTTSAFPTLHYYEVELRLEGVEAGYFRFREEATEDWLLLHDLHVYETYSRGGLGSQLIKIAENEAARLKKRVIIGHVTASGHLAGRKEDLANWYRRLGYTVTAVPDSNPDYYGTLKKLVSP